MSHCSVLIILVIHQEDLYRLIGDSINYIYTKETFFFTTERILKEH